MQVSLTFLLILGRSLAREPFLPILNVIDGHVGELQRAAADATWNATTAQFSPTYMNEYIMKQLICPGLKKIHQPPSYAENRAIWLYCRGPIFTQQESSEARKILEKLQNINRKHLGCISRRVCLNLEELAEIVSKLRDADLLKKAWAAARVGVTEGSEIPLSTKLYARLVQLLNKASQRNGYHDIGESWREEIEMDMLEERVEQLYQEILPLYKALHAYVRQKLKNFYGHDTVNSINAIPAHLLGNLWGQNWESIFEVVHGSQERNKKDELKVFKLADIARNADEFFQSIGFDALPGNFWKFSRWNNTEDCHANSINMFRENDARAHLNSTSLPNGINLYFLVDRISVCDVKSEEDPRANVYHELGHIQYYMQYQQMNNIFKDGANSAMHECIADMAVLAAFPFQRNSGHDEIGHLLKLALRIIPQAVYSLTLEKWRWLVFQGDIPAEKYNEAWWKLRTYYQGIMPLSSPPYHLYFDPSIKYHIVHNIPYIRKMMAKGRSLDFNAAMELTTGSRLHVKAFLTFFQPLNEWLQDFIEKHNLTTGWNF